MTIEDREESERDSKDEDVMRALVKRSLDAKGPDAAKHEGAFLRGVQARIRKRSRGRFFADGWSTTNTRVSYALVAAIMLVLVAVAWFALGPMGVTR